MVLKSTCTCVRSAKQYPLLGELLWTDTSVFCFSSVQLSPLPSTSALQRAWYFINTRSLIPRCSIQSPEIRHVCQEGQRGTSWQEWGQSRISVYPRGVSARSEPELPTVRSLTTSCLPVTWPGLSQSPPTATPALPLDRTCARTWGCRSRGRTTGS